MKPTGSTDATSRQRISALMTNPERRRIPRSEMPKGLYEVLLYAERHDWCYLGAYDGTASGPVAGEPPLVDLRPGDRAGIVIQLPGEPAELARQRCG